MDSLFDMFESFKMNFRKTYMASSDIGGVSDNKTLKRKEYIEWKDYFMALASLSAQRSKDPNTQVGACIVNKSKRIVGLGYNGMPDRCHDDFMPWGKESASQLKRKDPYVCHAEMNAIVNKNMADVKECTIYTTLFPCNECAKLIIQSGIKKVVYLRDKNKDSFEASRIMFKHAGVKCRKFEPKQRKIAIDLGGDEN